MTSIPGSPAGREASRGEGEASANLRDALVRQIVLDAVRLALEEGARKAPDPVAYLRDAANEVTRVVAVLENAQPQDGAALRAILAEAVVAVAEELIGTRQH